MVCTKSLAFGAVALGSLISSVTATHPVLEIIRRQSSNESDAVGTNLYNCHDNCGEAILKEEVSGYCNSTIFSTDYAACLQCSGPDNEDIWQYYGPYLTEGAAACGSSTVPADGAQADVATALVAQSATSNSATATSSGTVATATSTSASAGSSASSTASSTASGTASSASSTASSSAAQSVGSINGWVFGGLSGAVVLAGFMA